MEQSRPDTTFPQYSEWTLGDLICDLSEMHDFRYSINNSLPSHSNDKSSAPCIFFLMAYSTAITFYEGEAGSSAV